MQGITLDGFLAFGDLVVSAINFILAFSLLVYIFFYNWRNAVARAFIALLFFVAVVHASDILILNVQEADARFPWLRFQWLGIAFIPAAYLHFTDAVLSTTGFLSPTRKFLVRLSYLGGAVLFLLVASTDLVVRDGVALPWLVYFKAGPIFWLFSAYFFAVTFWGVVSLFRARARTLNPAFRRRMTYLAISFAAPALGAFPYMLLANLPQDLSSSLSTLVLFLTLIGSTGISVMTVVMAYSVAYQGVLLPDRVVKRNLIEYLLRGPAVGSVLLVLVLAAPRVERILGLPRDIALVFGVVVGLIFFQALIGLLRPVIDLLVYRQDRAEIAWIRELDSRMLTTSDLEILLENILNAVCDLFKAKGGWVANAVEGRMEITAVVAPRKDAENFFAAHGPSELAPLLSNASFGQGNFVQLDNYRLRPLFTRSRESVLGLLGVAEGKDPQSLSLEEVEKLELLMGQAELALEDRQLQQGIFQVLWQLDPEIRAIRRWQSVPRYAGASALAPLEISPISSPDFLQAVKEALAHYWGGPKLAESPLLRLGIVRQALAENGNLPIPALRRVLLAAIEALKPPESERTLNTKEWVLYNILEMKFIRGLKIREIAQRLAMSEADLYRKQRAAIAAVAGVLAEMEESSQGDRNGQSTLRAR